MRSDSTEWPPVAIATAVAAVGGVAATLFPSTAAVVFEYAVLPLAASIAVPVAYAGWHMMTARGTGYWHMMAQAPTRAITEENRDITDAEIDELRKLLLKSRRPLTNDEVAHGLSVSKGHASKRVTKSVQAGVVKRRKTGRTVAITLH